MIKKFLGLVLMLVSSMALAVPAAYVHEMTGSGSVLYCFVYLYIAARGTGRFGIDKH